jgi:hypothetical protein
MISGVLYFELKTKLVDDDIPTTGSISQTVLVDICLIVCSVANIFFSKF